MRLPEDNDTKRPSVNILPMIDVIFAILAFFILASLSLTRLEGLPVNLPQAVTATPANQVDVTLTILPSGTLYIGEAAVGLDDLTDELRSRAGSNPIRVTVRADETTPHGSVIAAMDQIRRVEQASISVATTRPN